LRNFVATWKKGPLRPWCKAEAFVGLVEIDNQPCREFSRMSPYFTALHGYVLAELYSEKERLYGEYPTDITLPDVFSGGICNRFEAFFLDMERTRNLEMFGS
jgi:hypothetical protein